jgi:hypothetical protein
MKRENETYLGDGLYASFDGWQIWLRAPRLGGDHVVALDVEMCGRLAAYVEALKATHTAAKP